MEWGINPPYNTMKRFNNYDVIRKISSGGQSKIYLCNKNDENKKYAVKVPLKFFDKDHITKEYSVLNTVKSKYVIDIIDYNDVYPFIVLPYIEGRNIYLYSKGKEKREKFRCFHHLCKGVQELHFNNVFHCDLKPSNVIMDGKKPKIIDFGSSKTKKYKRVNTCNSYSPLETSCDVYNNKTDIYSLGIMLYEILNDEKITPRNASETEMFEFHNNLKLKKGKEDYQTYKFIKRMITKYNRNRPNISTVISFLDNYI